MLSSQASQRTEHCLIPVWAWASASICRSEPLDPGHHIHVSTSDIHLFQGFPSRVAKRKRREKNHSQIFPARDTLILDVLCVLIRARNSLNIPIEVRITEIRHRVARGIHVVSTTVSLATAGQSRGLNDAMPRADDEIVAPPRQQIPGVDDDGARDRGGAHPRAARALDLEPAHVVLEQERDAAVVAVGARTDLVGVVGEHASVDGGVVEEAQGVVALVREGVEVVLARHAHQADGDGPHDLDVEARELGVEGFHEGGEFVAGGVVGEAVGPLVGVAWHVLPPDLEGLFEVGDGGAQFRDLGRVGELGDFLAAAGDVASVGGWGGPGQCIFLGLWAGEELGGEAEGFGDGRGRDGVVGQVEKTRGFEGV